MTARLPDPSDGAARPACQAEPRLTGTVNFGIFRARRTGGPKWHRMMTRYTGPMILKHRLPSQWPHPVITVTRSYRQSHLHDRTVSHKRQSLGACRTASDHRTP
eukprot:445958-Hanusia_phi.AAC.1